jgi:hypothetical protein
MMMTEMDIETSVYYVHLTRLIAREDFIKFTRRESTKTYKVLRLAIRGCIQKFPDWPPGASTANDTALFHQVQLYRYFMSQSSEFCRHNSLCCFSTSVYCCKLIFRYRFSPETFGYTLVRVSTFNKNSNPKPKFIFNNLIITYRHTALFNIIIVLR